jgi:hypothetical protein
MTETTRTDDWFAAPELRRLRYFHGQLLGARDFRREQRYVRDKLMLQLRYLLGYGVVCGLLVEPVPPKPGCEPDDDYRAEEAAEASEETAAQEATGAPGEQETAPAEAEREGAGPEHHRPHQAKIRVTGGLGVDCLGREVVVHSGCEIDLWDALPADERAKLYGPATLWVGVEYDERAVEPTRMVYDDACGGGTDCDFGYTEECYALRVTATRPHRDRRCCICERCEDPVLWLARIDDVDRHRAIRREQVHMEIRRPFGLRVPTVITGVNWVHGHTYSVDETQLLLGTFDHSRGLRAEFSDDVYTSSLRRGVVEIQVIEGGAGRNASTWYMGGAFEDVPDEEFTRGFRYRQQTREVLQDQDRVLITIRTCFILDRCCRPVDGTNVGGRVPLIGGGGPEHEFCQVPPSGIGPWTSGSGAGGATFESWFFVKDYR